MNIVKSNEIGEEISSVAESSQEKRGLIVLLLLFIFSVVKYALYQAVSLRLPRRRQRHKRYRRQRPTGVYQIGGGFNPGLA